MITHHPSPSVRGRVCVWMSHGACECVCMGARGLCGVRVHGYTHPHGCV